MVGQSGRPTLQPWFTRFFCFYTNVSFTSESHPTRQGRCRFHAGIPSLSLAGGRATESEGAALLGPGAVLRVAVET